MVPVFDLGVIKLLSKLTKTSRLKNISFAAVQQASKDFLFITEPDMRVNYMLICLSIAELHQCFLTKYQTAAPVVPFLCYDYLDQRNSYWNGSLKATR